MRVGYRAGPSGWAHVFSIMKHLQKTSGMMLMLTSTGNADSVDSVYD